MAGLQFREDMDDVRERLTTWWHGGDIGRPVMSIVAPREEPIETVEPMPEPPGWGGHYDWKSLEYRVHLTERGCGQVHHLGEAVPSTSPDLGPNCLALYLGCGGEAANGTTWFHTCIDPDDPESFEFRYDPGNFFWDFTLRLAKEQLRIGRGRFLLQFPDLIEGLDTLAAMRGNERLLMDLIERPDWVHESLHQITQLYFHYYDMLYDLIRDEVGGSLFWVWGPGRTAKFQCDFSAMIGPEHFGEFMVPVLTEMCERVSYPIYHWDGPGAIPHHDHLLSIPTLRMIQWTPGAGANVTFDRKWWPLYHRTIDEGKSMFIHGGDDFEALEAMKREFGPKLKRFCFVGGARSLDRAKKMIEIVSE